MLTSFSAATKNWRASVRMRANCADCSEAIGGSGLTQRLYPSCGKQEAKREESYRKRRCRLLLFAHIVGNHAILNMDNAVGVFGNVVLVCDQNDGVSFCVQA